MFWNSVLFLIPVAESVSVHYINILQRSYMVQLAAFLHKKKITLSCFICSQIYCEPVAEWSKLLVLNLFVWSSVSVSTNLTLIPRGWFSFSLFNWIIGTRLEFAATSVYYKKKEFDTTVTNRTAYLYIRNIFFTHYTLQLKLSAGVLTHRLRTGDLE